MGIADLIAMAMEKEGLPKDKCLRKIWMVDSKGLIVKVVLCCSHVCVGAPQRRSHGCGGGVVSHGGAPVTICPDECTEHTRSFNTCYGTSIGRRTGP